MEYLYCCILLDLNLTSLEVLWLGRAMSCRHCIWVEQHRGGAGMRCTAAAWIGGIVLHKGKNNRIHREVWNLGLKIWGGYKRSQGSVVWNHGSELHWCGAVWRLRLAVRHHTGWRHGEVVLWGISARKKIVGSGIGIVVFSCTFQCCSEASWWGG